MGIWRRRRRGKPRSYLICESAAAPEADDEARASAPRLEARSVMSRGGRARSRIVLCAALFAFAFTGLGVRLAVVSSGAIAPESAARAQTARADPRPRPEIVDRNGALLATNVPVFTLEVDGREVWDPLETAAVLAANFSGVREEDLARRLSARQYAVALSNITPAQQEAAFALGLPGVRFRPGLRRFYPQIDLAAHVVGHGEEGRGGVMGLERALDARLQAQAQAQEGPLVAALDIRVQQALEQELERGVAEYSAIAAWGVVMNVRTGEVIALASLPDFDPNEPGAAAADSRRNRATYDRYELGSAMKTVTAAAALEAGVAAETSRYDARGTYRIAGATIRDFRGKNRVLSFSEVIQYSSNIGAARMAADLGVERQKAFLKSVGLFEPLAIELAENRDTELPPRWGPVESATISYGHGISITPLHLVAAFAAVVNGGEFRTPSFLKADAADAPPGGAARRAFSPRTSAIMRRVLREVISNGSASRAEAAGYYPIGKTATADKPHRGGYDTNRRISSFIGAFPGYDPHYAVLVSYDEPKPTRDSYGFATAGWNAAPTFSRVVQRIAPTLGVMPADEMTALAGFAAQRDSAALSAPAVTAFAGAGE